MTTTRAEAQRRADDIRTFTEELGRLEALAVLNVRPLDDASDRGYSLMKYEAGAKKLTLWMTSYAAVHEDIVAGKLRGIAEKGPHGETRITASSAEIAAYLLAADRKRLFDKPLEFRRVASETPRAIPRT